MRRRERRRAISAINIVPYVDVMLVLLVIFMITAPLFNQSVIDIPSVGEKPIEGAAQAGLEILYEKGEAYGLIDYIDKEEQFNLDETQLLEQLRVKKILHGEDIAIIISAEEDLLYKDVIELLGRLHDEGHQNLNLAAKNSAQAQ